MRRRVSVALLAGVLLAGLVAVPGAPVEAQDMADLPRLGYEINPDRGHPGDEVHSQVNPGDVEAACYSGSLDFDQFEAGWESGEISPEFFARSFMLEMVMFLSPAWIYEMFPWFFPPWGDELQDAWVEAHGPVPETDIGWEILVAPRETAPPEGIPDNQDGQDFVFNVTRALEAAMGPFGALVLAPTMYPSLFVTTFVDPVSQEMRGETGNFDPETGEGTMLVPDLAPALYAVAAACAALPSYDQFPGQLDAALVAAWDWSVENDWFPTGPQQSHWEAWAEAGGFEAIFGALLVPRAIGIDFYCILQDDGFCATPPGPVGLIDDAVLDAFDGDGDLVADDDFGSPLQHGEGLEDSEGLAAVGATPTFTG